MMEIRIDQYSLRRTVTRSRLKLEVEQVSEWCQFEHADYESGKTRTERSFKQDAMPLRIDISKRVWQTGIGSTGRNDDV